jgi:CTP synthase
MRRDYSSRGFGIRGIDGMVKAAEYARRNNSPISVYAWECSHGHRVRPLRLCSDAPNSSEFDECTIHPVIAFLPEQRSVKEKGGTMRLGVYPADSAARMPLPLTAVPISKNGIVIATDQ